MALAAVCVLRAQVEAAPASSSAWETVTSDHFLVRYTAGVTNAEGIARAAESICERVRDELAFTKHDDFWRWERRVKICLHPTMESFRSATSAPSWAGAQASMALREIAMVQGSDADMDRVLRHEITHLVLREFMGRDREIPAWLREGVARLMERPGRKHPAAACAALMRDGRLALVADLSRTRPTDLKDPARVTVFYLQSAGLVGFMLEHGGSEAFRKFCGGLRDGKPMDDALRFTYPETLRSLEALDTAWKLYLRRVGEAEK